VGSLLDYMPIAAAGFAIPQFLPQLLQLRATDDTAGVSWSWATLTSVNNAAWFAYFAASAYWAALVPATSATLLAGTLAVMLAERGQARARPAVLISGWVALLLAGFTLAGRAGLGTLLTAAFVLQVTPSLWSAYRTARLTGVAAGTWLLILGELACWTIFGVHQSDPRLITLGVTGVTASALMLARIHRTRRTQPLSRPMPKLIRAGLSSGPVKKGRDPKHQIRSLVESSLHPHVHLVTAGGLPHGLPPVGAGGSRLQDNRPRCGSGHGDDDLALGPAAFDVGEGLGGLVEPIRPVEDGSEDVGLDELGDLVELGTAGPHEQE
jgi:hypothetical protein